MHIDCDSCPVRERHCADCMVTVLLEMPAPADLRDPAGGAHGTGPAAQAATERDWDWDWPDGSLPVDAPEERALRILVDSGLVAPSEAALARAVHDDAQRLTG